jgi:hypothetical protein
MKFIVDEHTSKNIDQLELAYEYIPYTQMTQIKNWKNCKYNFIEYAAIEKEAPNETLEEMSHISWDLLDVIKQKSLSGDEMVIMLVKTSFTNEPETYAIIHQFHEGIWLKKVVRVLPTTRLLKGEIKKKIKSKVGQLENE